MDFFEDCGDRGVEFLEARLNPETVNTAEILPLVHELDSDDFLTRQESAKKLERHIRTAKTLLREQMDASKSEEVRTSLRRILRIADDYCIRDIDCLRSVRAIECLEVIGTSKARLLLKRLASGSPTSPVTQEANAAIVRLINWVTAD